MDATRTSIRAPAARDREAFLKAVRSSRRLHRPWVDPPSSEESFRAWLGAARRDSYLAHLIVREDTGAFVGVVNASEIVRGVFRSAYLGYYAFADEAGRGLFSQGFRQVLEALFREHRLHRVEANIQPENLRSRALVERIGFRLEGYSPRYLKVGGRWRDHERWALLAEEYRPARRIRDRAGPGAGQGSRRPGRKD